LLACSEVEPEYAFGRLPAEMDQRTRASVLHVARLLDRAEEARAQEQNMMLPQTRLQMLKLAETYEHMADLAFNIRIIVAKLRTNPSSKIRPRIGPRLRQQARRPKVLMPAA
jgi:hypothetical protein